MKLNGDYLADMAQLEQCECYSWGGELLHVTDENGDEYLVNKTIGKVRQIASHRQLVGFPDKEIDFETLDKIPNSHNAHSRSINYAHINRWDNCQNGLIALSWMLYPDGRYFEDEDGFGGEDNDELTVYCVMDEDLNVVRPFTVVSDIQVLLKELREAK